MSLLILACICLLCTLSKVKASPNQTNVIIACIINNNETEFEAQGWELAIQEINDNSNFLPNIILHLQRFYTTGNRQEALLQALSIIQQQKYNGTHVLFPIVLGSSWSEISATINPLFSALFMGQISGSSSSPALSNTAKYPYFYR